MSSCPDASASWYEGPPSFFSGKSLIKSSILRIVMAASVASLMLLLLMSEGSRTPAALLSTRMWTPIFILVFCKLKSKHAILAPFIFIGIACEATVQLIA
uniref:Uncharacterized protein n=1 Tax=Ciona savignyi TaxID=51511 RepID=H2Y9Z1_CIOSA